MQKETPSRFFKIRIAGINIEVECSRGKAFSSFIPYLATFDHPDFVVKASIEEKVALYKQLEYKLIDAYSPNDGIELSGIEPLVIGNKIAECLLDHNVITIHGADIAIGNSSYLFTAPSGTGKTTHVLKWVERMDDAQIINGDKTLVKVNDDGTAIACGSPWAGKENLQTNIMVNLKSIILMERAKDNYIERISFAEAFPFLLQQVFRPKNEKKIHKTLSLMQRLGSVVSFWRFRCNNFKDDCFDVAYNALARDQK